MICVRLRLDYFALLFSDLFIFCSYNPVQDTAASTVLTGEGFLTSPGGMISHNYSPEL